MTVDITIGKIKKKDMKEVLQETLENCFTVSHETKFSLIDFLDVEQCPNEEDGCTEEDTINPGESYRSVSIFAISEFMNLVLGDLEKQLRPISTNDPQISMIRPYIDEINNLEYNGDDLYHKRRLNWLKFWCNRALQLYGDEAGIMFS